MINKLRLRFCFNVAPPVLRCAGLLFLDGPDHFLLATYRCFKRIPAKHNCYYILYIMDVLRSYVLKISFIRNL